jgi:hypothetical protein
MRPEKVSDSRISPNMQYFKSIVPLIVSIQLFGADGTARSKKGLFTTKAQRRKEYSFTPYSLCVGVFVVAFLFRFSVFATHCFGRAPFLRPYEMNAYL